MKKYKVHGVIIRKRNFSETDKILTVYTKEFGKINVLAKGVRKITSRRSSSVELFNQTSLFLYRAKFLDIVTEAETIESFPKVRQSLHSIAGAYELCELVDVLTREGQEHEEVFSLLVDHLGYINDGDLKRIHDFKLKLLIMLGFLSEQEAEQKELNEYIEYIAERRLNAVRLYS